MNSKHKFQILHSVSLRQALLDIPFRGWQLRNDGHQTSKSSWTKRVIDGENMIKRHRHGVPTKKTPCTRN